MFNLVEKRRWFFLFSALIIVPGLLVMLYLTVTTGSPLRLSIDFLGGSIYELTYTEPGATEEAIRDVFQIYDDTNVTIQQVTDPNADPDLPPLYRWSVRAGFHDQQETNEIVDRLAALAPMDQQRLYTERVSETVGAEVGRAAVFAVVVASLIVTGFILFAFRQVPNPLRYGACAISAMIHDVLVVMGIAAATSLLFGWEVDALFLTAVLTVVAFSVQDTIVLFDRIRENIPKYLGEPYETIVNRSIWESIHRSLATQLNAFFIMAAILLFGGESIKQFIAILFIGLISGTYSSIFHAVPLLVAWEKGELPLVSSRPAHTSAETGDKPKRGLGMVE